MATQVQFFIDNKTGQDLSVRMASRDPSVIGYGVGLMIRQLAQKYNIHNKKDAIKQFKFKLTPSIKNKKQLEALEAGVALGIGEVRFGDHHIDMDAALNMARHPFTGIGEALAGMATYTTLKAPIIKQAVTQELYNPPDILTAHNHSEELKPIQDNIQELIREGLKVYAELTEEQDRIANTKIIEKSNTEVAHYDNTLAQTQKLLATVEKGSRDGNVLMDNMVNLLGQLVAVTTEANEQARNEAAKAAKAAEEQAENAAREKLSAEYRLMLEDAEKKSMAYLESQERAGERLWTTINGAYTVGKVTANTIDTVVTAAIKAPILLTQAVGAVAALPIEVARAAWKYGPTAYDLTVGTINFGVQLFKWAEEVEKALQDEEDANMDRTGQIAEEKQATEERIEQIKEDEEAQRISKQEAELRMREALGNLEVLNKDLAKFVENKEIPPRFRLARLEPLVIQGTKLVADLNVASNALNLAQPVMDELLTRSQTVQEAYERYKQATIDLRTMHDEATRVEKARLAQEIKEAYEAEAREAAEREKTQVSAEQIKEAEKPSGFLDFLWGTNEATPEAKQAETDRLLEHQPIPVEAHGLMGGASLSEKFPKITGAISAKYPKAGTIIDRIDVFTTNPSIETLLSIFDPNWGSYVVNRKLNEHVIEALVKDLPIDEKKKMAVLKIGIEALHVFRDTGGIDEKTAKALGEEFLYQMVGASLEPNETWVEKLSRLPLYEHFIQNEEVTNTIFNNLPANIKEKIDMQGDAEHKWADLMEVSREALAGAIANLDRPRLRQTLSYLIPIANSLEKITTISGFSKAFEPDLVNAIGNGPIRRAVTAFQKIDPYRVATTLATTAGVTGLAIAANRYFPAQAGVVERAIGLPPGVFRAVGAVGDAALEGIRQYNARPGQAQDGETGYVGAPGGAGQAGVAVENLIDDAIYPERATAYHYYHDAPEEEGRDGSTPVLVTRNIQEDYLDHEGYGITREHFLGGSLVESPTVSDELYNRLKRILDGKPQLQISGALKTRVAKPFEIYSADGNLLEITRGIYDFPDLKPIFEPQHEGISKNLGVVSPPSQATLQANMQKMMENPIIRNALFLGDMADLNPSNLTGGTKRKATLDTAPPPTKRVTRSSNKA